MARPRLEGLMYFSHDCNAHGEEDKMVPLFVRHGLEGYGHYWFMLEVIYTQKNGELLLDDIQVDRLTAQMHTTREIFFEILITEFKLGLFFSKTHKELFNNSGKLTDNSEKLFENSEKTLVITSSGIRKRRKLVMSKRLKERDKKDSDRFSQGKTAQEHGNNAGKREREKGKGFKGKDIKKEGEEERASNVEKISFQKAEKAWTDFEPLVKEATPGGRLTIPDPIAQRVFFDLGGLSKIQDLIHQNGTTLKTVFCAKYAAIESDNYKARTS